MVATKREKARDILIGILAGYVGGIIMMMIIHFLIKGSCADGGNLFSQSTEVDCFQGWMLLAGEKTCFYDTYFDVNTTVVGTDSSTSNVDLYFNEIATIQEEIGDILICAVYKNDRGFYQWISDSIQSSTMSTIPSLSTTAPATNSCINHLEVNPANWGLSFVDGSQACIA